MNLFYKKTDETENFEDFNTLELPFVGKDMADPLPTEEKPPNPKAEEPPKPKAEPEKVKMYPGGVSPLDALKNQMAKNAVELGAEQPAAEETKPELLKEEKAPEAESPLVELHIKKSKSSLLKRCMPYIYDEEGVSQVDTKPDYVLESVEDIIRSAEQRAEEKIAERYKFTDSSGKPIKTIQIETSINEPVKVEAEKPVVAEDATKPLTLPQNADILFDDFSGKKTVVTPRESVTVPYSNVTNIQTGIQDITSRSTTTIPVVSSPKSDTMDDIVSHTRPVNIKDAPAIKPSKPVAMSVSESDELPEVSDDYRSPDDTKRIGMKLKKARRSAFTSLVTSVFAAVVSVVFAFIIPDSLFENAPFVPCLIQSALLVMAAFGSFGIFASFKGIFTKKTTSAAPVALAVTAMLIYMLCGLIFGFYPSDPALLAIIFDSGI